MEAIDELISAAQTFYDDACATENGRSRSWEHCYRVFRDARTDPSPDYDYLSLHLAFYLASWGMYRGSSFLLQKDYRSSPVEWCNRFVSFGLGYALSWSGVSSCWVGCGVSRDLVRMSRLR